MRLAILISLLALNISLGSEKKAVKKSAPVFDKEGRLPLWELGLGIFAVNFPHYRGSDQERFLVLPFPNFIYRGERLQADSGYIEGRFVKIGNFSIKLSMNFGLAVESDKNRAREGMPDLDNIFEVGAMASYLLWENQKKKFRLTFNFPYRAVMATNFTRLSHVGYFSVPFLQLNIAPQKWNYNIGIDTTLAAMYGSEHYHSYFYEVPDIYARYNRPGYRARRGYSGAHATLWLTKRIGDFFFFPFFRYDYLKGAVFDKSPLVKTKSYFVTGIALTWWFYSSERRQKGKQFR